MRKLKFFAMLLVLLLAASFLAGCGITLFPTKRKPLEITFIEKDLPTRSQKILVKFQEVIPDKPLKETVWDNVYGPFWDLEESQRIGYTQNFKRQLLTGLIPFGGGAAGAAMVYEAHKAEASKEHQAGNEEVLTRILIPFGRIFTEVFQSGLQKSFSRYWVCFDDMCLQKIINENSPDYLMQISISRFEVWEQPLNHINLKASVVSSVQETKKNGTITYEANKEILNSKVGSGVLPTSSSIIRDMNTTANTLAQDIAVEILRNGIRVE